MKRAPALVPLSREHHEALVLAPWGAALREHVQWEERQPFPLAGQLLALPALEAQLRRGKHAP